MMDKAKQFLLDSYNKEDWKYSNVALLDIDKQSFTSSPENDHVNKLYNDLNNLDANIITIKQGNIDYNNDISGIAVSKSDLGNFSIDVKSDLKKPLIILNYQINNENSHLDLNIKVHEATSAKISLFNISQNNVQKIVTSNIDVDLGKNANLTYLVANYFDNTIVYNKTKINLSKHATFDSSLISQGTIFERNEWHINQQGEGVSINLHSLLKTLENSHCDFHIITSHFADKGFANKCIRGIAMDKSRCSITGKIFVAENATKNESHLENKNLIVGDTGVINTRPQLEIYNDDVICSHGATVGNLSTEDIFYLQSRGISYEDALDILKDAFVQPIIDNIIIKWIILEKILQELYSL